MEIIIMEDKVVMAIVEFPELYDFTINDYRDVNIKLTHQTH